MKRLTSLLVLPAVAFGLAACGAEPAPGTTEGGAAQPETSATVTDTATATTPLPTPDEAPAREVGTDPGDMVPAFVAKGTTGEAPHSVDSQKPSMVTVYGAGSTTCPYTNKYAQRMQEIEASYAGKDVQFVWLYPNRTEADADKTEWHQAKGLAGTFVIDEDAKIAKILDIQRTPEMVVTAADGTITYRGAIDDGKGDPGKAKVHWLSDAIDATLEGRAVKVEKTVPAG